MTSSTLRVLRTLLAEPTREHNGLELSKDSGIAHGTMYVILVRLDDRGRLANRLVRTAPPRRYYRLTSHGAERARDTVAHAERPQ